MTGTYRKIGSFLVCPFFEGGFPFTLDYWTVNPLGSTACSAPVVTRIVRGPGVALAATVSCTVNVLASVTVTVPTVMPGPAFTVVVP